MRILMLTQWFDPEPTFKGLAFARKLVDHGHEVEVLTGFPNYPGGQLYPGYPLRLWQRESVDGISIIRVPLYPSHDRSVVRRTWNYLSFAIAATVLGPALVRRPDVIYAYHPPGTVGLPALALGRWFSAPVVYDVNDLWPDTIISTGMWGRRFRLPTRLLDRFCRFVYRHADRVTVVTAGFRRALIERGVAADRVDVIYNWAPEQQPEPLQPILHRNAEDGFHVVFAGTMGLAQGLDAVLEAAARCVASVPRARFRFVGGGVDADRLERRAREMRLANVEFLGRQPLAATQAILHAADALLVHLKDDPLFAITIPSKTQAYLAAGRPIVMAVRGDAADLVIRAGAGVTAEPGNPESIAEAVRKLAEMPAAERDRMGRAGREFYERELAIGCAVAKFDALFREAGPCRAPFRKRLFDISVALTVLLTLWPLMAIVALAVRLRLGSPILFRQLRPGWNGRPFRMLKFRTMGDACAPSGRPLPDGQRLTGLGRFLRRLSLDELPELWNVLTGDMSLVGPRPLLMDYCDFFTSREKLRFRMPPGITGWAQIHGRNRSPWDERLERDVWYVEHWSFALDLRILAATARQVLRAESVVEDPRSLMLNLDEERGPCAP
ncbi:MAG TPA: sugar transferase [Bryobacteraceae bacterium]|nr:sugar transferase [Bryobacteraceae bacterium]